MKKLITAAAISALALAAAGPAFAKMNGFGTDSTATQGSSGKPANTQNSTSSQGDLTTTTTGPKGALKNGATTPNQTTTTSGPGNSNKMP